MPFRRFIPLLVCLLCLALPPSVAVATGKTSQAPANPARSAPESAPSWLDEKLGDRIPLDTHFTDSTGKKIKLAELIDRPTLVVPVYYRCRSVCNLLLGELSKSLPDISLTPGEDFRVVTFSIDEQETPELAAHNKQTFLTATGHKFPAEAWFFLTGDSKNIRLVTDAAGYRFQKEGDEFLHPVAAFVVDKEGRIVRYLNGYRFAPLDLTMALVEASEGRIGTPIRKAISFCFSYDPEGRRYTFNLLRVSATVILLTLGSFLLFLFLGGRKKKS